MRLATDIIIIATIVAFATHIRRQKATIAKLRNGIRDLTFVNARLWDKIDDSAS